MASRFFFVCVFAALAVAAFSQPIPDPLAIAIDETGYKLENLDLTQAPEQKQDAAVIDAEDDADDVEESPEATIAPEDEQETVSEDSGTIGDDEPAESEEPADERACFPADATVELESGAFVPMSQLNIGDRVKVGADEFSDVFGFTHKVADESFRFVRIEAASGDVMRLTALHYLYVNGEFAAASSVKAGDRIVLGSGAAVEVAAVSTVVSTGLYNPQTVHGDIVVDGIVASTYTATVEPKAAHAILAPLRMVYNVFGYGLTFEHGANKVSVSVN